VIRVRPAKERGVTQTGWLESRHTFSFNRYYNRDYSGFRDLLVINEDLVEPAQGFGTHSHDNMEILSYVVDGAIEHRDSTGASGVLRPNELQRMSAGTGVTHSEFNPSKTEKSHFLQIWIVPEREGIRPEYEQRAFPEAERAGRLRLIGSPEGRGATVRIHQDVLLYDSLLKSGETVAHEIAPNRYAWVQVIKGSLLLNGTSMGAGDGAAISAEANLRIQAREESQILLFDLK
jgi:quercetin 2,3-dioxygenase